jgi:hypothetical protein
MVYLDFTGVEEASDIKKKHKEGYYLTKITKAADGVNDQKKPHFNLEFTIQQGEFKGEVVKQYNPLVSDKGEDSTKRFKGRIKRLYSRVLPERSKQINWNGNVEMNIKEFEGSLCMIKIVQEFVEANGDYSAGYAAKIDFWNGIFAASDYKPEYDKQLKHSDGYQAQLDAKASNAGNADVDVVIGEEEIPF